MTYLIPQLSRIAPQKAKEYYRSVTSKVRNTSQLLHLKKRVKQKGNSVKSFKYYKFKGKVLAFLDNHRKHDSSFEYYYSKTSTETSLYASVYALMTLSILGELSGIPNSIRHSWAHYFDSYQSQNGLFIDPSVYNEIYDDSDWWGARHLALHMISGYTALGSRPSKPFNFLSEFSTRQISSWLNSIEWHERRLGDSDVDNKIMNIGCLLQYQRDQWQDKNAADSLNSMKSILFERINPQTGMWGNLDVDNPRQRSRLVQFAYHLFPLFFYDGFYSFNWDQIIKTVLKTQNGLGGFGVATNSSACEDIDSIDILIRAFPFVSQSMKRKINKALNLAFKWVTANMVDDGGFVFRLNESFVYGSPQTMSLINQGAMLPTWFRTLSLMYMARHLGIGESFNLTRCPGYEQ
ncbi:MULTISPECIES: hypothetical protein [unclassified Cyanobium]|uniref:hypothetical protein n=1 Tax=unclassified Cyanobium TaxID=2627006 RepID=UPI0020CE897E|nr:MULTISPECIES: hypothetical protein [unclassified Cyanobium]MCP9776973.1 hypothetical protein [Cyanobium sp. Tous-M-B4]MCP9875239.1 hypothetical protein [Cyanobium sp. A2C-AMD]